MHAWKWAPAERPAASIDLHLNRRDVMSLRQSDRPFDCRITFNQASLPLVSSPIGRMTVPTTFSLLRRQLLALAVALSLGHGAWAKDADPPICPVGVLKCPKPKAADVFALCKANALLDFYRPGLP